MSHHIEDGRVWAVDKRTGEKRRVMPAAIKYSKNLSLAPSERARGRSVAVLTEPVRPKPPKGRKKPVTEPETESEPDISEPVTTPDPTNTEGA